MSPLAIIKYLDVLKKAPMALAPAVKRLQSNQLLFKGAEELLHHSIIVTVPFATPTLENASSFQNLSCLTTGILTTTIGIENQSRLGITIQNSFMQSSNHRVLFKPIIHRPAHNLSIENIYQHRKIQSFFPSPDICDVRKPNFIRIPS
jgi:hypothetical protein